MMISAAATMTVTVTVTVRQSRINTQSIGLKCVNRSNSKCFILVGLLLLCCSDYCCISRRKHCIKDSFYLIFVPAILKLSVSS
jgi:hypothetical protein